MKPLARTDALIVRALDDRTVVWDEITQARHELEPLAAEVWRRCDGGTSVAEVWIRPRFLRLINFRRNKRGRLSGKLNSLSPLSPLSSHRLPCARRRCDKRRTEPRNAGRRSSVEFYEVAAEITL